MRSPMLVDGMHRIGSTSIIDDAMMGVLLL